MPDGILSIGAVFDKARLEGDFTEASQVIKAGVEGWTPAFESSKKATREAAEALQATIKQMAEQATPASLAYADSLRTVAEAQKQVRQAALLMKDSNYDAGASALAMAASQQKLASAQAAAAADFKVLSAEQKEAAAEANLSSNVFVAAFQRIGLAAKEMLVSTQASLAGVVKDTELSAGGITGALTSLMNGPLLIAASVGMVAHSIDDLSKSTLEIDHLSEKTGIAIQNLAGLREIVKETGAEWDPFSMGLLKFEKALGTIEEPTKQLREALQGVHIDLGGLQAAAKDPEQALQLVAMAFSKTNDHAKLAAAAVALFGRGGYALIPILKEQGANLTDNMHKTGALTGETNESAEAARRWAADIARLSMQFHAVLMPVMENAENAVRVLAGVFEAAAAIIMTAFEGVATAIASIIMPLFRVGVILKDILLGNWSDLKSDAEKAASSFADTWKAGMSDIKAYWAEVGRTLTATQDLPKLRIAESGTGGEEDESNTPGERSGKGSGRKSKTSAKEQLPAGISAVVNGGSAPTLQTQSDTGVEAQVIAEMQAETKAAQDFSKDRIEAYREEAEEKMRLAREDYQDYAGQLEFEVRAGKMTDEQRLAALQARAEQEKRIVEQQSQFIAALDMDDAKKYRADLRQQEQETRQWARTIEQLDQQMTLQMQNSSKKMVENLNRELRQMTNQFNVNVAKWVVTGKGFEQSMAQMLAGISENFVKNVMKMTEQEIMAAIEHKSLLKQGIIGDAKAAAAKSFDWASSWGGPIAGAAAAAAAFAGVMAFDTFDAGGVVGNKMGLSGLGAHVPVLAEAGERVLTPSQTRNFETMVNTRTESRSSTVNMGGVTQNFSGGNQSPRQMQRGIQDAIRRGRLRMA